MVEGLYISLVGVAAVFVSLTTIMFLMMGIERAFRGDGAATIGSVVGLEGVVEVGADMGRMVAGDVSEQGARPDDSAEVAAIAVALVSHLRVRGRELGTSLRLSDEEYRIEMGDAVDSAMSINVNGDSYRGRVGGGRLPSTSRSMLRVMPHASVSHPIAGWRSAYPPTRGGHWCRRGWTGRMGNGR
jgi:hypothetical protein